MYRTLMRMGVNEFGSVLTFMELTLGARMDKNWR